MFSWKKADVDFIAIFVRDDTFHAKSTFSEITEINQIYRMTLQWRHNERDGVSNKPSVYLTRGCAFLNYICNILVCDSETMATFFIDWTEFQTHELLSVITIAMFIITYDTDCR